MSLIIFGAGFLAASAVFFIWFLSAGEDAKESNKEIRDNFAECEEIIDSMRERLARSRAKSVETRKFIADMKAKRMARQSATH